MRTLPPLYLTSFLLIFAFLPLGAQTFLNGNFEQNTASPGHDEINLSNEAFNVNMKHCWAFGSYGDMDIINTSEYNGPPQEGSWFVAFTGGGTDAISMELSAPLKAGKSYTISFWDRASGGYVPQPFQIGISNQKDQFGTPVYTAGAPEVGSWTQRVFTFTPDFDAQYITVQLSGANNIGDWAQADNFTFVNPDRSITTLKTATRSFCACASLEVPFTSSGTFLADNIYRAELSDAQGRFTSPTVIGELESNRNQGTLTCTLPCELPAGTGYRVRVVSDQPATIGTDNGEDLSVNAALDPKLSIRVSPEGEVTPGTLLTFTATPDMCGTNPVLHWFVNGVERGGSSRILSAANLKDGDVVSCSVVSNAPCAEGREAVSNDIIVQMKTPPAPEVTINANGATNLEKGQSLSFRATPVNGGTEPRYEWRINGRPAGGSGAVFTATGLKDGDEVSVMMTSSEAFLSIKTAISNVISVSVNEPVVDDDDDAGITLSGKKKISRISSRYYMYVFKTSNKGRKLKARHHDTHRPMKHNRRNLTHCHRF